MWAQLIKEFGKAMLRYSGKYVLRQSGVFGIYGSIKTLGGIKKIIANEKYFELMKKLVMKNGLRALHMKNFPLDFYKFGFKETLKRTAKNRITPMSMRKIAWFINEIKRTKSKKEIKKDISQLINKSGVEVKSGQVKISNTTTSKQVKDIDNIVHFKPKNETEKQVKDCFMDNWLIFNVNSPQTGNFAWRLHFYNLKTQDYRLPIKSGWYKSWPPKYYTYFFVPWYLIKWALLKKDFGKVVFSRIRIK